ncbi:AzlD domain-containing protein, partial [Vibrio parahaemolyticus]
HEQSLWLESTNPYIWAALLAGLLAWRTKNILLTTVVSMAVFLLLNLVVFSA